MRSVGPIIGASSSYQCGEKVIKSLAEASSLRRCAEGRIDEALKRFGGHFSTQQKALLGRLGAHAFSAYNLPLCIIVERGATGGVNTQ